MRTENPSHAPAPWAARTHAADCWAEITSADCPALGIVAKVNAARPDFEASLALILAGPAMLEALRKVLPYAMTRAEDLDEAKASGNEDPNYPGAAEAWAAIEEARRVISEAAPHLASLPY